MNTPTQIGLILFIFDFFMFFPMLAINAGLKKLDPPLPDDNAVMRGSKFLVILFFTTMVVSMWNILAGSGVFN